MNRKKILMAGSMVAGALLMVSGPASAQSLQDVGTGFKEALMRDAKACKKHLTGFNVASVKNTFSCFVTALKAAAKNALLGLARAGWNTMADMLASKGGPAAQKALGSLLSKVTKLIPGLSGVSGALQSALGTGAKAFAAGVKACGSRITALNLTVLKSVFGCAVTALKGAAGTAALAAVQNLFDEGVKFLKTSPARAKSFFTQLASKLPVPAGIKNSVINGIGAGSAAFADAAGSCRKHITALSAAAAKATFSCLGQALKGALKVAGVEIIRGLFDQFTSFIATNCAKAADKLGALASKVGSVFKPAQGLASSIGTALKAACTGAVDKVASLNPVR